MSVTASIPSDNTIFHDYHDNVLLDTTVKPPANSSFIPHCLKTCLLNNVNISPQEKYCLASCYQREARKMPHRPRLNIL